MRLCLRKFAALFFVFAISVAAQAPGTPDYLVVVELSPQMARRQMASAQMVYDLVRSGFQDHISPGERFAVWFFSDRMQTSPTVVWDPAQREQLAKAAANLFTGRIYARNRRRDQTLGQAAPFIATSPQLAVFFVTDGFQPLMGTPFDTQVNTAIAQNRDRFTRADKPFLMTLLAQNGRWVGAGIHTNFSGPLQLPEFPWQKKAPAPKELLDQAMASLRGASNANDQAVLALRNAIEGKTPPAEPPPKAVAAAPVVEQPKGEVKPEPVKPPPPAEPVVQKPIDVAAVPAPAPVKQIVEEKPAIQEKPPEIVVQAPVAKAVEPPPVVAAPVTKAPEPEPVRIETPIEKPAEVKTVPPEPVAEEAPADPPMAIATATASQRKFPWPIVAGGLALIALVGWLVHYREKKRAAAASLITQSFRPRVVRPRNLQDS